MTIIAELTAYAAGGNRYFAYGHSGLGMRCIMYLSKFWGNVMRGWFRITAVFVLCIPVNAQAQNLTVNQWIDQFVDMSVLGAGSTSITSGSGEATGGITLRSLSIKGELKGQVTLSKQEFKLLSE